MRVTRAVVGAFLSLAVLYVVAINVFLSTSLFESVIDGAPETIDIHYTRGWSVLLGRIHAEGLSIRGRDSNVEWILKLDEVEFDVSFAALMQQRFEASRVHGRGISFRVRQRLDAPPASIDEIAALPPIDGFGAYSVRPPPQSSPDVWSDADYHLWSARLEEIVADDVREIWIDRGRFEGHARITGRFGLKPLRAVEVGPAHVAIADGHLRTGATSLLDRLDGSTVDLTVATFDPRTVRGADLVHRVSLVAHLNAQCADVARLPLPLPEGLTVAGPLDLHLGARVDAGVVAAPSHVEATVPTYAISGREHRFIGALALAADVTREASGARLTFRAEMTNTALVRATTTRSADGVVLRAPRIIVTGDATALDLAHALDDLRVRAELPEGRLADARDLTAYIPATAPLAFEAGHALASALLDLSVAEGRLSGHGELRADDLDIKIAKMRVRGRSTIAASFGALRFGTTRVEGAEVDAHVLDGSLASARAPRLPLVHVKDLRLRAHGAIDLADPLRDLSASIALHEADVLEQGLFAAYLPKGNEMRIVRGRARFGLACDVEIAHHLARGTLALHASRLGLAYRELAFAADVGVRARVHDWHWERGDLALDQASVEVTRVSATRRGSGARSAEPAMTLGRVHVVAQSKRFALSDPLARVRLSASIVDGHVRDSSALDAFVPDGAIFAVDADGGAFASEVNADIVKHVARAQISVRAERCGIRADRFHVVGDVAIDADVSDWKLDEGTLAVRDAHVTLTRVAGGFPARDTKVGNSDFGAARVEVSGRAARLDLARLTWRRFDGQLVIEEADIPDARSLQTLLPSPGVFAFESGSARVSADLTVSSSRGTGHGFVEVLLTHAGVRIHETHLVGDFHVLARVSAFDAEREIVDLSESRIQMRDVQVTGASATTSRWGGDLAFERTRLRLGPEMTLDGVFALDARDANPLLAIFLGDNLPKAFLPLTRMPRLRASARFTMGARFVALRDIDARGGNLSVRGIYVVADAHSRGALVVEKGPFSAGLRVDDDGGHVHLFGLDAWLRDEKHLAADSLRLLEPSPFH